MRGESKAEPAVRAQIESGELTLLVNETVYSREVLFRTCYWFTDRCYLFISRASPIILSVRVRQKPGGPSLESVAGDLENALIDQQVRHDLEQQTSRLRELIVAKAFAEGNFLDDPPVGDDRDPLEVAKSNPTTEENER